MWITKLFALISLLVTHSDGLRSHRYQRPFCSGRSVSSWSRLGVQRTKHGNFGDCFPSSSHIPFIVTANAILMLFAPEFARAAEVSIFEDPAVLKQALGGLVVGVAWIVPYFVFNVIIAPKIGLIEEDKATEEKNKNRDYF